MSARGDLRALNGALVIAELATKHWDGGLTTKAQRDVQRARAFCDRLMLAEEVVERRRAQPSTRG